MIPVDKNKPIWQLTIGELLEIIKDHEQGIRMPKSQPAEKKEYVYGLSGIAKIFDCSITTAQVIKNSGVIDKAITQTGRKIVIDAQLALELAKQK